MKVGGLNLAYNTSEEIYENYLNELFEINKEEESQYKIVFIHSFEENNDREVYTKSDEKSLEVNETRKRIRYENDTVTCTIYANVKNAEAFYYTYVLPCLKIIMGRNGWITIHSSVVKLSDDTSILLAAPSGCGKTTFSFSMIHAGYRLVSDDLVFMKASKNRVSSFYRQLHVDGSTGNTLPWAKEILSNCKPYMKGRSKLNVDFKKIFNHTSYVSDLYRLPGYILLPIITHKENSSFTKISWDIALYRLLGQSYIDLSLHDEFQAFMDYLKSVKIMLCEFGTDMLSNNEEMIKNLINTLERLK